MSNVIRIDLTIDRNSLGTSAGEEQEVATYIEELTNELKAEFDGADVSVSVGQMDRLAIDCRNDDEDFYADDEARERVRVVMDQVWNHGTWSN